MTAFVDLLGAKLLTKQGEVDTESALRGKTVGLYFSAHWCPPCRGFTPQLAKSYTSALKAKGLEIVFVSGDQNEKAFSDYYTEMPWLALPFSVRDKAASLNSKFDVKGIPSLVLLSNDGTKLTSDARSMVSMDPTGEAFPWTAEPGKVPKGMTKQFAEQKAKPFQMMGPILEKTAIAGAVPGLLEFFVGVHFMLSPCGISILVKWLLVDGLWNCISSGISMYTMKKTFELKGESDLQAYLIRKERDGTVDEDMEAKARDIEKNHASMGMLTYLLLAAGFYLYATTSSEGCSEQPSHAVYYLLVLRLIAPCAIVCFSGAMMVGAVAGAQ
eukprot:TRINITY_DN25314_c1_g1_i1.p1 TRINITY_DN25314_c1_g1~~TRINITY_DN25314_c1_g1_i1.p1  ORF type:complete len:328 (+),score=72.63 TRINITY_DN25314_c1_g1_i1:58-1041(+)